MTVVVSAIVVVEVTVVVQVTVAASRDGSCRH